MRDQEFKEWLTHTHGNAGDKLDADTIVSLASHIECVDSIYGYEPDIEFQNDGMENVMAMFESTEIYPKALAKYREFCEDHPPK